MSSLLQSRRYSIVLPGEGASSVPFGQTDGRLSPLSGSKNAAYPSAYSNFCSGGRLKQPGFFATVQAQRGSPPPGPGARRPVSILLDFIFRLSIERRHHRPMFRKNLKIASKRFVPSRLAPLQVGSEEVSAL